MFLPMGNSLVSVGEDRFVARKKIENWEEYKDSLSVMLGQETKLTQQVTTLPLINLT